MGDLVKIPTKISTVLILKDGKKSTLQKHLTLHCDLDHTKLGLIQRMKNNKMDSGKQKIKG